MHSRDNYEGKICIEDEKKNEFKVLISYLHRGPDLEINRSVHE